MPELPRRRRRHYYERIAGIGASLECTKLHLERATETPITETECTARVFKAAKELHEIALDMEAEIEVERVERARRKENEDAQEELFISDSGSSIRA